MLFIKIRVVQSKKNSISNRYAMVGGDGFEPSKSETTDLQSVAFGHSAILPNKMELVIGIEPTTC